MHEGRTRHGNQIAGVATHEEQHVGEENRKLTTTASDREHGQACVCCISRTQRSRSGSTSSA